MVAGTGMHAGVGRRMGRTIEGDIIPCVTVSDHLSLPRQAGHHKSGFL